MLSGFVRRSSSRLPCCIADLHFAKSCRPQQPIEAENELFSKCLWCVEVHIGIEMILEGGNSVVKLSNHPGIQRQEQLMDGAVTCLKEACHRRPLI